MVRTGASEMTDELKTQVRFVEDGAVVLSVRGFIDTNTAPALERALREHGGAAKNLVVLDLAGVDYVSSAGWGVVISVVNAFRARGADLRLAGMCNEVDQVYRLLEFPSIVSAFETVDEALAGAPAGR